MTITPPSPHAYTVDDEGNVSAPSAMSAIENLSELKNVKSVDWLTEPKGESTATLVITYEEDGVERKEEHTVSIDTSAIEEYEAKKKQAEADANNSEQPQIGKERIPESVNQQANPADPKKGETIIKAKLEAEGINGQPFDYKGIFGNNPETKATLVTDNGDISMDINPDTGEVTFNGVFKQEDVKNKDIWVEFNGQKIKGKLIVNESDGVIDQANATTTYTIKLYQVRNTDIVVETKDEKGNTASNPNSKKTGGSVKVKGNNKDLAEVEIPTDNKETKTVDPKNDGQINSKNKDDINAGLTFEIEGQENGFLVDKDNKKVYKAGEIEPDKKGLDPTKIEFTEKPLVDSDTKRSEDKDYVKVDFSAGKHGKIDSTNTTYVIKGVTLGDDTISAPSVTENEGWEFTGWDPIIQNKYDGPKTHVAQYKYIGGDIVPQEGNDKPDVPDNFVLVEFQAGEHGSLTGTTKYWVNPDAGKTLADIAKPSVTANEGWKFTGWNKEDTTKITGALEVTAEYKAEVTTDEIVPYLPGEEEPTKGSDGKTIPDNYITVTFKSEDEAKGTVKVGGKEGAEVKAKVKPGTNLAGKVVAVAKEGYGFTEWNPALGEASDNAVYTAKFIKDGSEIGANDPIPEGWHKVTVKQDADSIQAGTVTEKTYAVKDKLSKDILVDLTGKAADKYENPAWYDGETNLGAKPTADLAVSGDKTIIAKADKKAQSEAPKVNQPTEGDDKITGTGKPGAKIVVKDKDDNVIGETEVGDDGKWEVPVPADKPLKEGDKITVEQTEKGKKPSTTETTVKGKDSDNGSDGGGDLPFIPDSHADEDHDDKTDDTSDKEEDDRTDAEKNPAVDPDKTGVEDLDKLTNKEKQEVIDKVKKVNPAAVDVTIDDKGNVTLIYNDGSTNMIPAFRLVYKKEGVKIPSKENMQDPTRKRAGKNVKTGIGSASGLFGVVGAALAGLFVTKKKEDEDK